MMNCKSNLINTLKHTDQIQSCKFSFSFFFFEHILFENKNFKKTNYKFLNILIIYGKDFDVFDVHVY